MIRKFTDIIRDEEELREILGHPANIDVNKETVAGRA